MNRVALAVPLLLLTAPLGTAGHLQTQDGHHASFDHKTGNEWWVEVVVDGSATFSMDGVEAQDEGGDWVPLEKRSWGAWAASFHIEPGHDVRFRATWDDGDEVVSCWFSHPEGVEDCTRTSDAPATYLGGDDHEDAHDVALGPDGGVAVAGQSLLDDDTQARAASFPADLSRTDTDTVLGGSQSDRAFAVAFAPDGGLYFAGDTESADFPTTPGAHDRTAGDHDGFVARVAPDGSLAWSTRLGGSGFDRVTTLAVDGEGRPVVAGNTQSCDFPTTPGAHGSPFGSCADAFVTRLSADGTTLVDSTVYGGSSHDRGLDLAIAPDGDVVLLGMTRSDDIPTTPGAHDRTLSEGGMSLFVVRLDASLSDVEAGTYLGPDDRQSYFDAAVAVDAAGVHVTGRTTSDDWPTTPGAYQTDLQSPTGCSSGPSSFEAPCADGFVTAFTPALDALRHSTYLGGAGIDEAHGIALDADGRAHVVGETTSEALGTPANGRDAGFRDGFHALLSADGSRLEHVQALGGADWDNAHAVAHRDGTTYAAGFTGSRDFPTSPDAHDRAIGGHQDMFVAVVHEDAPAADLTYDSRNGNEWWVQVHVSGDAPDRVQAMDTGGPWTELTLRDWGDWAASFHVEPGHDVRFRALVDGAWHESCWFTHPGGEAPDGGQTCGTGDDGGDDGQTGGGFDASFDTPGGNEWWVEVYVQGDEPIAAVHARDDGGAWVALEERDWGAWARSFHVENGSIVEFRATSSDGDNDVSRGYVWPSGEPA